MIWLDVLAATVTLVSLGVAVAMERQMREMARNLATRGQSARPLTLRFPTGAARELAREASELIDEAYEVRRGAAEERRVLQENLASFSHDVRTPLAGAQGYLQLYTVAGTAAERDECVAAAVERLGAMRGLVDALFEYAKADDGGLELVREPVNVADVVAACAAERYPSFAERRWQPDISLDEDVVAFTDREALARIVGNLLGNALRHGAAAPRVALRRSTGKGEGGREEFALSVANEAEGLEDIEAGRLFERFYRGDAARRAGGSGLGLAIAASLADALGLSLRAAIDGDTFTVTLSGPLAAPGDQNNV
ncbi:ATP-binding protein [Adlercreutzia mucosicola]|uniref:ATP-binding protein n=1 Tax=Adlercreutzia mucosicola TaxID=580026 RepID=UPI0013662C00